MFEEKWASVKFFPELFPFHFPLVVLCLL